MEARMLFASGSPLKPAACQHAAMASAPTSYALLAMLEELFGNTPRSVAAKYKGSPRSQMDGQGTEAEVGSCCVEPRPSTI